MGCKEIKNNYHTMKILITGVHGFVGSNLVEYLAPANEIYGLDIIAPEKGKRPNLGPSLIWLR